MLYSQVARDILEVFQSDWGSMIFSVRFDLADDGKCEYHYYLVYKITVVPGSDKCH